MLARKTGCSDWSKKFSYHERNPAGACSIIKLCESRYVGLPSNVQVCLKVEGSDLALLGVSMSMVQRQKRCSGARSVSFRVGINHVTHQWDPPA
jgi:hypothetical protein